MKFPTQQEAHAYLRSLPKYKKSIHETAYFESAVVDRRTVDIGAYSMIGVVGFGFDPQNPSERWPHIGRAVLEDGVEIGCHCIIERGVLSDTIIGENTKIDHHCLVGHNSVIGKNCKIGKNVSIGGSVTVGDNSKIWMGATIRDHITIGKDCTIGMGAVVVKDVPDGWTVTGNPARRLEQKSGN